MLLPEDNLGHRFVSIKVNRIIYLGMPAIAIHIWDFTKKMRVILDKVRQEEEKITEQ